MCHIIVIAIHIWFVFPTPHPPHVSQNLYLYFSPSHTNFILSIHGFCSSHLLLWFLRTLANISASMLQIQVVQWIRMFPANCVDHAMSQCAVTQHRQRNWSGQCQLSPERDHKQTWQMGSGDQHSSSLRWSGHVRELSDIRDRARWKLPKLPPTQSMVKFQRQIAHPPLPGNLVRVSRALRRRRVRATTMMGDMEETPGICRGHRAIASGHTTFVNCYGIFQKLESSCYFESTYLYTIFYLK